LVRREPDIAVLQLVDAVFDDEDLVYIIPENELPWKRDPFKWLCTVRLYHCPVEEDMLYVGPDATSTIECNVSDEFAITKKSHHHVHIATSLLQGSSGGGLITSDGRLLAILSTITTITISTLAIADRARSLSGGAKLERAIGGAKEDFTAQAKSHSADVEVADVVSVTTQGRSSDLTMAVIPSTLMVRSGKQAGGRYEYSLSLCDWLAPGSWKIVEK
jgi:hypothetical protein